MDSVRFSACETDEAIAVADDELIRRTVSLRERGKSLRAIADEVGKSHTWVRDVLRREGLDTSAVPRSLLTAERDARVVRLYTAPEPRRGIAQVSEETRLPYNTVRAILSRAGVLRDRGPEADPGSKRNRTAIPYRPDNETRDFLEFLAHEEGKSLDESIDGIVQEFRQEHGFDGPPERWASS